MSKLPVLGGLAGPARQPELGLLAGGPVGAARVEPELVAGGLLRAVDGLFLRLDRLVDRLVSPALNPLTHTGAIANATFLVASVTGGLLLFWYSSSVNHAYESVREMGQSPLTAGLVRSLHRYSSDACMAFVLLHALKLFFAGRFAGARWLAWITGAVLVGALWFVGWLGYWLVWDSRAQAVAVGTARLLDVLPIFADPLSRSFLADETVNSLLFFMVFFFHMLIPLGMGIPLWLHITRLSRPKFLPDRPLFLVTCGLLVLTSLIFPADLAEPARMSTPATHFAMDAWYLAPLALTDRLGAGALWAITLLASVVLLSIPWALSRRGRAAPSVVELSKCNGCTNCYTDCPYEAIQMVPRSDGRGYALQAQVDPEKCVGCGICAGSCNSAGIGLPQRPVVDERHQLETYLGQARAAGEEVRLAFLCAHSAGGSFRIDPGSGRCAELPGYRVLAVPCAGFVHMLTVEGVLRQGAAGALVVGCGPGDCNYREGAASTGERIAGERVPFLRKEKVPEGSVRFLRLDRTQDSVLVAEAARFARTEAGPLRRRRKLTAAVGGTAVAAVVVAAVVAGSVFAYAGPPAATELVVSFKHPGQTGERCRKVPEEELLKLPPHMRNPEVCERGRASVRLEVTVDGVSVHEQAYEPRGLSSDGNSVAVARIPVSPGVHQVQVRVRDGAGPDDPGHVEARALTIPAGSRGVVVFDKLLGFVWHEPAAGGV